MVNISDKWIEQLDILPIRDYVTLTQAIFHGEDKPAISTKYQFVADEIYKDIKRREQIKEAKKKCKENVSGSVSDIVSGNVSEKQEGKQEEKEKGISPSSPLSSPSFLPPDPYSITPYNPPTASFPEKEKGEALVSARAGACGGDEAEGREKKAASLKDRFEKLWAAYPKKEGKKVAFEKYKTAVRDGVTDEEILAGIERYKERIRLKRIDERYIAQGSTYFSQRRWEDVYDAPEHQLTPDEEREYQEIWGG